MKRQAEKVSASRLISDSDALLSLLVIAAQAAENLGERSVFMAVMVGIEIIDSDTAQKVRKGSRMFEQDSPDGHCPGRTEDERSRSLLASEHES